MESNSPALISDYQLDWPARLRMATRRSLAAAIDLALSGALALSIVFFPLAAELTLNILEPTGFVAPTLLNKILEHYIPLAVGVAILTELYLYGALWESGPCQAGPGKILLGLKSTGLDGQRQSFGTVVIRQTRFYVMLAIVCLSAEVAVNAAAEFIQSLQIEALSAFVKLSIIGASFALCLVTEHEQTMYDMIGQRLVVNDATVGWSERKENLLRQLRSLPAALNANNLLTEWRDKKTNPSKADFARTLLICTIYLTLLSAIFSVGAGGMIAYAMSEVEKGLTTKDSREAASHFACARKTAPGIALLYEYDYATHDNVDLARQEKDCARLFAVRGESRDYLNRARLLAKQQQYKAAESDYRAALSERWGSLSNAEKATADTELTMLQLEEESEAIPKVSPEGTPKLILHQPAVNVEPPPAVQ